MHRRLLTLLIASNFLTTGALAASPAPLHRVPSGGPIASHRLESSGVEIAAMHSTVNDARVASQFVAPIRSSKSLRDKDGPKAEAEVLFRSGSEKYAQGRYVEALQDFLDAQTRYPSPVFQYNIGLCHEQLGEYEAAIRAFETYLRNAPDADDRAAVERRIERLRAFLQKSPDPSVSTEQTATQATTPPATPPKAGRAMIWSGVSLASLGLIAGGVGSIVFGVKAKWSSEDLATLNKGENPDGLTFRDATKIADNGQFEENMQFVSLGVGAGLVVGGAALVALGLRKRKRAEASPTQARWNVYTGPRQVVLRIQF